VDGPGQTITIAPGQQLRDIKVVMTPGGVIAGRITGRDGRPLAGARVRAMKPWIQENQRQLRAVQEVVANDLGEFRLIWLMPGRYYLSATYIDYSPAAPQLSWSLILMRPTVSRRERVRSRDLLPADPWEMDSNKTRSTPRSTFRQHSKATRLWQSN
jgi:hypothetical protein